MKVTVENIKGLNKDLKVLIDKETMNSYMDEKYEEIKGTVNLKGFRPGKVPSKVLMGQFQPSIEADFIDKSVNRYYSKALKEEKIVPVNMGSISDVDFLHGGHFKFKVSFEVEPIIKLPKLKKNTLKVEKTIYITDKQDIDMAIDEVRNGHAEVKTIEDGAKIEDFIICDLQELDETGLPIIGKKLIKKDLS